MQNLLTLTACEMAGRSHYNYSAASARVKRVMYSRSSEGHYMALLAGCGKLKLPGSTPYQQRSAMLARRPFSQLTHQP